MITKDKINRQAKALLELYKTLPQKTRKEIRKMILEEEIVFEEAESSSELAHLSDKSFGEVWDNSENEHWDEFFKEKGYV